MNKFTLALKQTKNVIVEAMTTREKVGRGLCTSLGKRTSLKPVVFRTGFLALPFLFAALPLVPLWLGFLGTGALYFTLRK